MKSVIVPSLAATALLALLAGVATTAHSAGGHEKALFERADIDGNGEITLEEWQNTRTETFTAMDADSDGFVTADEAKAYHEAMRAEHQDEGHDRGQRMFDKADTNGDGKISSEEFASREPRMFERFDADGDGTITLSEVEEQGGRGGWLFEKADLNADGKVTLEEAQTMRAQMFATMDADGDGFVTQDEAKEARKAMRDQAEAEGRGPGQRMFEMADTDGDGKISADEFAATAPMKFERMDDNGDGVITKDEVQHKSHGMGGCDGDKA